MSETQQYLIGDESYSLSELAGFSAAEIAEVRSMVLPEGVYIFRVEENKFEEKEVPVDYDNESLGKMKAMTIVHVNEVTNVLALENPELDMSAYLGRKKVDSARIKSVKDGLGKEKAFLTDIGVVSENPATTIKELMDNSIGVEYVASIKHAENKNNPEFPFVNMRDIITMDEFMLMQEAQEAQEQQNAADSAVEEEAHEAHEEAQEATEPSATPPTTV